MSAWDIVTVDGTEPGLVEEARTLFAEYHEWLGEVVCSRTMAQEIAALPGQVRVPDRHLSHPVVRTDASTPPRFGLR